LIEITKTAMIDKISKHLTGEASEINAD